MGLTDATTLDAWVDDFIANALNPRRLRLSEALSLVSRADLGLCAEVVKERHPDALRAVNARHYAAAGRPYGGHTDPTEAWEAAAPDGWAGDPARGFLGDRGGAASMSPASLREAVLMASDPVGMGTAEALAGEFLTRAARLMGRATHRSVTGFVRDARGPATLRTAWRVGEVGGLRARWLGDAQRDPPLVIAARARGLGTSVAQSRGEWASARVTQRMTARCGVAARDAARVASWAVSFEALGDESPFAPLADLWTTGYALEDFGDGQCVFAAPVG